MSLTPEGDIRWDQRTMAAPTKIDDIIHMSNDDLVILGQYGRNPLITRMTSDGVISSGQRPYARIR